MRGTSCNGTYIGAYIAAILAHLHKNKPILTDV